MHKLKLKQAVVPAHPGRERPDIYEIVRLMPELPNRELSTGSRGGRPGQSVS